MMRALLLSGGMDSAALAWREKPQITIFVDYGQKPAEAEQRAAAEISKSLNSNFQILSIDCSSIGAGELAASSVLSISPTPEWWPFRNQLLATIAAAKCVALGVSELMIGTVKDDSVHADGSETFVRTLDNLFGMQEGNLRFTAPAHSISAAELIFDSGIPHEILAWSHSCFISNTPCLRCRGCLKSSRLFELVGLR